MAVISPNHLIRAGLTSLVSQLHEHALVTEAVAVDQRLSDHDVAIYDVGALASAGSYRDLQSLLDTDVQVIGLVYDSMRDTLPPELSGTSHVITLSVTPAQLLDVLDTTAAPGATTSGDASAGSLPYDLTEREFEVLRLIGANRSNADIAAHLYLSVNTVKTYIRLAYRKIGVDNRAGAILWAVRHGLAGGGAERGAPRPESSGTPASSAGPTAPDRDPTT